MDAAVDLANYTKEKRRSKRMHYLEGRPRYVLVAEFDGDVVVSLFGGNVVHSARPVLVILALKGQTIVSNIFV